MNTPKTKTGEVCERAWFELLAERPYLKRQFAEQQLTDLKLIYTEGFLEGCQYMLHQAEHQMKATLDKVLGKKKR